MYIIKWIDFQKIFINYVLTAESQKSKFKIKAISDVK